MNFSNKLEELMLRRGLNQQKVADAVGRSQKTVSDWLNGSVPHKRNLEKLSAFLNIEPVVLIDDSLALPDPTEKEWQVMEGHPPTYGQLQNLNKNLPALEEHIEKTTRAVQSNAQAVAKELIEFLLNELAETKAKELRLMRVLERIGVDMEGEIAAGTVPGSTNKCTKKK